MVMNASTTMPDFRRTTISQLNVGDQVAVGSANSDAMFIGHIVEIKTDMVLMKEYNQQDDYPLAIFGYDRIWRNEGVRL